MPLAQGQELHHLGNENRETLFFLGHHKPCKKILGELIVSGISTQTSG